MWSKALPAVLLLSFGGIALAAVPKQTSALSDEVRHGLLMLPYDNVFEELAFTIDGSNNVTLSGQVTCSIVKSDAESAVRNISRVGRVIDNIEVLPLPTFDGSIRIAACGLYSRGRVSKSMRNRSIRRSESSSRTGMSHWRVLSPTHRINRWLKFQLNWFQAFSALWII